MADQSWPVECVSEIWPRRSQVRVWVEGKGWIQGAASQTKRNLKKKSGGALTAAEDVGFESDSEDEGVAIVGFQDPDLSAAVVQKLRLQNQNLKILEIGSKGKSKLVQSTLRTVSWNDLLPEHVGAEIELLDIQERVSRIQNEVGDAPSVALLLQDDPDPDGLASALALRKVLGRNAQSAPIVSFGAISRPENLAMARLLEISVENVTEESLNTYSKIIMVDCQPSFFKGREIRADVIVDHHPRVKEEDLENPESPYFVPVVEIRENLGAISTLMTQFLRSKKIEVSSRVATALLYGIKSDTLTLNRQVSESDLEAFLYLYPKANGSMLRKIEKPELPTGYLEVLRKALKGFQVKKGIAILSLGEVDKEEWIPQAADFALQCEGAEWSIGCGIFDSKMILSLRNNGHTYHGGDLFKELFDGLGCAGGHRSMAKAIIGLDAWNSKFGPKTVRGLHLQKLLVRLLSRSLQKRVESNHVGHA